MSTGLNLPTLAQLTDEQRAVVQAWGQGLAVSAGAGSGKTTTLTLKCFELLKRNPLARLCAVSFTERSASDLRLKLGTLLASEGRSLQGEGGRTSGHWVMTIHGLCGAILREFPREAGFEGDEAVLSDTEASVLWSSACESLWSDGLALGVQESLDRLLLRENRGQILELLGRIRGLPREQVARSLVESGDPAAVDLVVIALEVLGRYQKSKRRAAAIDFEDLERGADQALEHESVRNILHRRFDLVLIDECQDTNPTQASILLRLARSDRSNLCVVGDAKQSIYRFRDADVTAFERLCEELPVRLSLTWNFRSRSPIIDYVNQVCDPLFAASGLTYEALVPKKATSLEQAFSSVEQVELSQGPEQLARWIRQQQAAGIPLESMALLLRQIRGRGTRWIKALSQAGIPLAIGSGGFFWQDPRVQEMVAFLKAWEDPQNTLSLATFLRAPWLLFSDEEMDRALGSGLATRGQDLWRLFISSEHWAALALKELEARRGMIRPGEVLEKLMLNAPSAIEGELGPAWIGLWHRSEDLSADGRSFRAITQEFSEAIERQRKSKDVPPPRNLGQLNVLTIHSSKGLEFPHVILVDFPNKALGNPDAPMLFWLPPHIGARLGLRDEDGERDTQAEAEWRQEEVRRNLAEQKRLFYVALTRAQERLVLVTESEPLPVETEGGIEDSGLKKEKKAKKPPKSPLETDHWREWIRIGQGGLSVISASSVDSLPPSQRRPSPSPLLERPSPVSVRVQRPRHSVTEWLNLQRCERAYEWTFVRPRVPVNGIPAAVLQKLATQETRRFEGWNSENLSATELGTRVHSLLEHGDLEGIDELQALVGLERLNGEALKSWVKHSHAMLPPEIPRREVWRELAFEIWIEGQSLVGALDRVVCTAGAEYEIIDFKVLSRWKEPAELVETYRSQVELYAFALSKLDPAARNQTKATLVAMSPTRIEEVAVDLPGYEALEQRAHLLARRAQEIVNGRPGAPKPGKICQQCEFRGICPEAEPFLAR